MDTAPTELPSTFTSSIAKPAFGVIVKVMLPPHGTLRGPLGAIEPPGPAVAVTVEGPTTENEASIVWSACTSVNV